MSGFHVPRTVGWTVYLQSPDLLSDARQLREGGLGQCGKAGSVSIHDRCCARHQAGDMREHDFATPPLAPAQRPWRGYDGHRETDAQARSLVRAACHR